MLPLLKSDLLTIMQATSRTARWRRLDGASGRDGARLLRGAGLAAAIPRHYEKGLPITRPGRQLPAQRTVYHAGPALHGGRHPGHRRRAGAGRHRRGGRPCRRPSSRPTPGRRPHHTLRTAHCRRDIGAAGPGRADSGGDRTWSLSRLCGKKAGLAPWRPGLAAAELPGLCWASQSLHGPAHPEPLRRGGHRAGAV